MNKLLSWIANSRDLVGGLHAGEGLGCSSSLRVGNHEMPPSLAVKGSWVAHKEIIKYAVILLKSVYRKTYPSGHSKNLYPSCVPQYQIICYK